MTFLVLDQSCEQALNWVGERLTRAGLSATHTFNLQVARLAHPDCLCPHHGSSACTCQMIVLLVYNRHEDPATLVIHGRDGRAWVSLANPAGRHSNQHLDNTLRRILIPPLSLSREATYESQPGRCRPATTPQPGNHYELRFGEPEAD